MKKWILNITLGFLVLGCQDLKPVEKPDDLIDRETMEEILFDLALVNAARGFNIQQLVQNKIKPETYIFEKYSIDSLQFAASTTYYATRLEEYRAMYTRVKKRVDTLRAFHDSIERKDKKRRDSIRKAEGEASKKRLDSIQKSKSDTLKRGRPSFTKPQSFTPQLTKQPESDG